MSSLSVTLPPKIFASPEMILTDSSVPVSSEAFYPLYREAEKVRWCMTDLPWDALEKSKAPDSLRRVVKQIAAAELTTWSAARMFLNQFEEDADFSQWISIWLYEETKHPFVLMQWLRELGEEFDADFVQRGRQVQPFIRSKAGTLALNILSEIEASAVYFSLSRATTEPVLHHIALRLAGDEARHASSFFVYAKRAIESSKNRARSKIDALKALYLWLTSARDVKHPVAMVSKLVGDEAWGARRESGQGINQRVEARMLAMFGILVDAQLNNAEDVLSEIKSLADHSHSKASIL